MIRYGFGLRLDMVFFTHFHADHYLGLIGLLRTMAMMAEAHEPLRVYGPQPFITQDLPRMLFTGQDHVGVKPELVPLQSGDVIERNGYSIQAIGVEHRVPTLGYVIAEASRPGRFDAQTAQRLGVPPGPLYSRLQSGHDVVTPHGMVVKAEQVVGPSRPGRKLAISGDTRPCRALAKAAQDADVLIHEATFSAGSKEEQTRAVFTQHSTAAEAGEVAQLAGVKQLVLSHFSSRHDTQTDKLVSEARQTYAGPVMAGYDGLTLELPLSH
jgi:ribonuclease Z